MTRDRKGSAAHEGNLARHETPEFRCYEPEETVNFSATWLEEYWGGENRPVDVERQYCCDR